MPQVPTLTEVSINVRCNTGPRWKDGGVTLRIQPSDRFEFSSDVAWPDGDSLESFVLEGIRDGFVHALGSVPPCLVTLTSIEYHPVSSCGIGFRTSARQAVIAACFGQA